MTPLTPLALENATLLRHIQAQDFGSKTELAAALGRDLPNLNKTLKRLAAEDLVLPTATQLTDAGANAVRMLDQLEAGEGAPPADQAAGMPKGFALIRWRDIEPDPLNPRKEFDDEAIAELADSIDKDDLLENLVVRPYAVLAAAAARSAGEFAPTHRLVAGERRHRAIGELIARGPRGLATIRTWSRDQLLLCKVVEIDDVGHRRIALVENLQRKDLKPLEEAQAIKDLMAVTGQGTAEIADELKFTQRWVQQRLQLLELPAIKQVELTKGVLTIEGARQWIAAQPKPFQLGTHSALALLEVAWAISVQKGADRFCKTPVDHHRPAQPPEAAPGKPLINFHVGHDGRETVGFGTAGWEHLTALARGANPLVREVLEPHVRKARAEFLPADWDEPTRAAEIDRLYKEKAFLTAWLNPPFEVSPGRKKQMERDERERETQRRRAQQEADLRRREDADRQAQQQEAREKKDREWAEGVVFLRTFRALENEALADPTQLCARLSDLLFSMGFEGPFALTLDKDEAVVTDAHGKVWRGFAHGLEALRRVMAMSLNAALGLPLHTGTDLESTWAQQQAERLAATPDNAGGDAAEPSDDEVRLAR